MKKGLQKSPIRLKTTETKEKKRRKMGREEKKVVVKLLLFVLVTLEMVFEQTKLLDERGLVGSMFLQIQLEIVLSVIILIPL